MPRALPQDIQDSIKSALMNNRSPEDIAGEFGIHPKTVRRYRNKLFGPMVPATRGALKTAKDVHRMLIQLEYSMSYRSAINVLVSMDFHAGPEVSMGEEVSKLVYTTVASSSVL
ncbi:hypothetical protein G6F37_014005 [Rhizopus arrhizus]|nr:hypothetical protein G6F37_014005 [Rhizopus arrhizus]